jgi:hypothetical protein
MLEIAISLIVGFALDMVSVSGRSAKTAHNEGVDALSEINTT